MKKTHLRIILFISLLFVIPVISQAQNYLIDYTGSGQSSFVDIVKIKNLSQGTSVTMDGTDTLHLIGPGGINSSSLDQDIFNVYPNPMNQFCKIKFYNAQSGSVRIMIFNISGKPVIQCDEQLPQGAITYSLGGLKSGAYLLKVVTKQHIYSSQIVSTNLDKQEIFFKNESWESDSHQGISQKSSRYIIQMGYNEGDLLLFEGMTLDYIRLITLIPTQSQTIDFEFITCTDADNNVYPVVTIGNQTWMAENLKTTKYKDGAAIPLETNNNTWSNLTTPAFCWYDNNQAAYGNIYGALYNWYSVETENLCPTGWHMPTTAEWDQLTMYLGGLDVAGGKLKETSTTHWASPNTGATNQTGFTGLPSGYRNQDGNFIFISKWCGWWSSSEIGTNNVYNRMLRYSDGTVYKHFYNKTLGFSVRCLRD